MIVSHVRPPDTTWAIAGERRLCCWREFNDGGTASGDDQFVFNGGFASGTGT
jgi:hypothetical protein